MAYQLTTKLNMIKVSPGTIHWPHLHSSYVGQCPKSPYLL
jgi:hypothetical protein